MPRTKTKSNGKAHAFGVRTRIARAAGEDQRQYTLSSIRALPTSKPDEVLLQASDGKQAVCLIAPGEMADPRMVPPEVLPTRKLASDAVVKLVDGQWQSSEGKLAEDTGPSNGSYPPIGEVLPAAHKRPYYETRRQAEKRRGPDGTPITPHVVVGVDLSILSRIADGLGTTKLTLMVPVPVKGDGKSPGEVFVDKAVCVCPADKDDQIRGIGVFMPLTPGCANTFYEKLRKEVVEAEKRCNASHSRTQGGNGHDKRQHAAKK